MLIKRMRAVFGCLDGDELELREGLNIISAPNESGKSTWCAFIQAMLYGIDTTQREKGGVKPDKVKFAPWSGKPMSGEMEIEYGGRGVTLARRTRTENAPMRDFSAVYTGTSQPVAELRGADAGLALTGMSRQMFLSSVFVRQSGLSVQNSAELEKRIAAIALSGEEDVSFSETDARLRAWLRKRRFNRSGALPALENEKALRQRRLESLSDAAAERDALEKSISDLARRTQALKRSALLESDSLSRRAADAAERARKAQRDAQENYFAAKQEETRLRAGLDAGPFGGAEPETAEREASEAAKKLDALKKAVPKAWLIAAPVVACAAAINLGLKNEPLFFVAAAAMLLCAALLAYRRYTKRASAREYEKSLLDVYGTADAQTILTLAKKYGERYAAWQASAGKAEKACGEAEKLRACAENAERELLSGARASAGENAAVLDAQAQAQALKQRLSMLEGRLSALGDPMVINTELEELTERIDDVQRQYDALMLASQCMAEADAELQLRFSPALGKKASEYMSRLTGGKYDRLLLDRELAARVRRTGDISDREQAFLSQGTADQLYLALRLAICALALPEGFQAPLVLDDALVNFDDARMRLALELLRETAKTRQVILLTCHDREKLCMDEK